MKLRYRFRVYPTVEQQSTLERVFGTCRFVYNWALRLRTDSYAEGVSLSYADTSSRLTDLKKSKGFDWMYDVSCVPPQQALRHLQTAFVNFFEKRSKYPKFKKKRNSQSAEYSRSAFKWCSVNRNLVISGLGRLKVKWSRQFNSKPSTVTITKDTAGRYFATLVLDETIDPLPKTGQRIGVDLGINRLATLSSGEKIPNPRYVRRMEKKLAQAQRILSRRKKGSSRWERQRLKVARIHAKIVDCRQDYMNKVTTSLVRRFDAIAIEDLSPRNMVKNHRLAKSLSDVSFGTFRQMLEYKCRWYGKELLVCDRFFPSTKRCSGCGFVKDKLPLNIRNWTCPECKACHDRDHNAAKNILGAGQALTARGETVRRGRGSPRQRSSCGNANHSVGQTNQCSSGIPVL